MFETDEVIIEDGTPRRLEVLREQSGETDGTLAEANEGLADIPYLAPSFSLGSKTEILRLHPLWIPPNLPLTRLKPHVESLLNPSEQAMVHSALVHPTRPNPRSKSAQHHSTSNHSKAQISCPL